MPGAGKISNPVFASKSAKNKEYLNDGRIRSLIAIRLLYDSLIERFLTETFPYNRQFNFEAEQKCADSSQQVKPYVCPPKNIKQTAGDVLPKFNQKIVLKTLTLIY